MNPRRRAGRTGGVRWWTRHLAWSRSSACVLFLWVEKEQGPLGFRMSSVRWFGTHPVIQAGLKLVTLPPPPPECWDRRYGPPHPALICLEATACDYHNSVKIEPFGLEGLMAS